MTSARLDKLETACAEQAVYVLVCWRAARRFVAPADRQDRLPRRLALVLQKAHSDSLDR